MEVKALVQQVSSHQEAAVYAVYSSVVTRKEPFKYYSIHIYTYIHVSMYVCVYIYILYIDRVIILILNPDILDTLQLFSL